MSATGKTPILLYGSTTASNVPAAGNLTNSSDGCEVAINVADGYMYYKDPSNAIQKIGYKLVPVTNGGTGLTSVTAGYIPYGLNSTTLGTSSNISTDGTNLAIGGLVKTSSNAATPNGGYYINYHAVTDSRSWKIIDDYLAYGDFAILQSTTQTGSTYASKFYIDPTGNATVNTGNLVIGTSGKGIDFSATPQPAGMTSELLADYEEGTWTPVGNGITYAAGTVGKYTKVGNLVTATFTIVFPTTVDATAAQIKSFPYVSASSSAGCFSGYTNGLVGTLSSGTSLIYLVNNINTAYIINSAMSAQVLVGSVTYQV